MDQQAQEMSRLLGKIEGILKSTSVFIEISDTEKLNLILKAMQLSYSKIGWEWEEGK